MRPNIHLQTDTVTIWHGDSIATMRELPDNSVDSIVTDPPYGLGFMGKAWDALPPGEEWAAECLRVLKPGGHLLAFGGSRTWHRLAVAVEDAGFEIRDSVFWLYGSGFPKHRASLKPACEPAVMGRKPFSGSLEKNESAYGTGALAIEECRIGSTVETWPKSRSYGAGSPVAMTSTGGDVIRAQATGDAPAGRWPSNVLFDEGQADMLGDAQKFFYVAKAPKRERPVVDGVAHPTVKPLALMRYLVKLVTPPGGVVLDPFAGSGTTAEACLLEGFRHVSIEREAEYLPLIEARLDRQSGTLPTAA